MTNTNRRESSPFARFAAEYKIEMSAVQIPTRTDGDVAWNKTADHWRVTLWTSLGSMSTVYSKGSGLRRARGGSITPRPVAPTISEVLESVQMDASSAWHSSFEEWCSEMGADTDSCSALATYEACRDVAACLEDLLGPGGIDALMEVRGE